MDPTRPAYVVVGAMLAIAASSAVAILWINNPSGGWNIIATAVAASFVGALVFGHVPGLLSGVIAVLVAGSLIELDLLDPVYVVLIQLALSSIPIVGAAVLGELIRSRISVRRPAA